MTIEAAYTLYLSTLAFFLGAAFGSFLDCMAVRAVRGETVLRGRSHCGCCGHVLGAPELVPVLSYLFLRGRCRHCGKRISAESLYCELALGVVYLLLYLRFGQSVLTLRYMALCAVLLELSLIDLKSYTIPDAAILTGLAIWFCTLPFTSGAPGICPTLPEELLYSLLGGFGLFLSLLLLSLLFDHLSGRESLGGGDLKLFFLLGLYLKPAVGLFALILSCLLGLAMAGLLRTRRIPFGPAISLAFVLSLLFGQEFVGWYLRGL